jgi:site-specific DNA-methyltransferase (adenine-specific)
MNTPDNTLFYGDNLDILRNDIADESIDLVYLDPPFNSNATYNVIFTSPGGDKSQAQVQAFKDSWNWEIDGAERAYADILKSPYTDAAELIVALRKVLGTSDLMAYLAMMAVRLIELHRVLKPTGSLYLHCDSTVSHYLKILLDAVFTQKRFCAEITWKRTTAHSNVYNSYGDVKDSIFYYRKTDKFLWNQNYHVWSAKDLQKSFPNVDANGRRWRSENLRNPGLRPNLKYQYTASNGVTYEPHPNGWTLSLEKMQELDRQGRLHFPNKITGRLRKILYADEFPGIKLQNIWDDIPPIGAQAIERLGYPTQKPVALLERIIAASSNEGDIVLDPFCGCGTTVHAAQKLNRRWIGIDITHLAVRLIERRLHKAFPNIAFTVRGVPQDVGGAQALADADKYQFQLWALSLVEAQPFKGGVKGADGGVDGIVWFYADKKTTEKAIVSVKGGKNISDTQVKDLITTVEQTGAKMGFFVTLAPPTKPMMARAAAAGFYKTDYGEYPKIQIFTVEELLRGRQPLMPWRDDSVFKKPKREDGGKQNELDV